MQLNKSAKQVMKLDLITSARLFRWPMTVILSNDVPLMQARCQVGRSVNKRVRRGGIRIGRLPGQHSGSPFSVPLLTNSKSGKKKKKKKAKYRMNYTLLTWRSMCRPNLSIGQRIIGSVPLLVRILSNCGLIRLGFHFLRIPPVSHNCD